MEIEALLNEAALEQPGVGMPLTVVDMAEVGWVSAMDEYLDQDDMAWSICFLLLYRFLSAKDHLA